MMLRAFRGIGMVVRIVLSIAVACFFLGAPAAASADDDSWLASSRTQIMRDSKSPTPRK
jgi:hypothetical protein